MINEAKQFEEEDQKLVAKINARTALDAYIGQTSNHIDDPDKLANKLSDEEKETLKEAIKESKDWLAAHQEAEKEEFEAEQKKLEGICNPIIQKAYGGQTPPPGGDSGEYENPEDL